MMTCEVNVSNIHSTYCSVTIMPYNVTGSSWAFLISQSETVQLGGVSDINYDTGSYSPSYLYTLSGLSPSTNYNLFVELWDEAGCGDRIYFSFTTTADNPPTPVRPSYFSWDTSKVSRGTFNLTASEWNKFEQNISAVFTYKSASAQFTHAVSGQVFLANLFDEINDKLSILKSTPVSGKATGNIIYASDLNALVSTVNSIT